MRAPDLAGPGMHGKEASIECINKTNIGTSAVHLDEVASGAKSGRRCKQ